MFQKVMHPESSALATRGSHSLFEFSLRDRITATIIREEAAESLLPGIQGDAELAALNSVLNRYNQPREPRTVRLGGSHFPGGSSATSLREQNTTYPTLNLICSKLRFVR